MTFRPNAALQQLLVAALLCASLLLRTVHGAASDSASTPSRFWRPLSAAAAPTTESASATCSDEQAPNADDRRHHACAFFLWDVPSLIQYKLCEHLLRHNVYEAKGGKKMVRIRPGSALEYLYPLSRHAPDRCALCGHTFEDHLRRWWEKKGGVGTAYDRLLDATYDEGVSVVYLGTGGAGAGNDNKKSFPVYSFHRRYVEDLPKEDQDQPLLSLSRPTKEREMRRSKKPQKNKAGLFDDDDDDEDDDEYEKYTRGPVHYRIPRFSLGMGSLWKALGLLLARNMALDEVDKLIELETKENQLLERRASMF